MLSYIGPGGALSAIGSFLALLAAVLLALLGFVWYPIKRMLRARKAKRASALQSSPGASVASDSPQAESSQVGSPQGAAPQGGSERLQTPRSAERSKPLASTASENGSQV